ncbi:MAG: substrate-binding domain-containing protein [Bacteroidales bacterium]|nr:substrate-binding domain-containing protein [Bacteroidales bacterium]
MSEKTRNNILSIIEESGYIPNEIARSLATGRKFRFASILPSSSKWNSYWDKPLEGIIRAEKEISEYGINSDNYFFNINNPESFVKISGRVIDTKPDGVLLGPVHTSQSNRFVKKCNDNGIEVILIDSNINSGACASCIGQNPYRSGNVAAKLITGSVPLNSRLLIINTVWGYEHSTHLRHREEGFRDWIEREGLKDKFEIITRNIPEEITNISKADLPGHFDAIFVTSNASRLSGMIDNKKLREAFFVSYDLTDENVSLLKKGLIDVLIGQRPEYQGYIGIYTLFNKLILKKNEVINHDMPIDIIIKENYIDYINHEPGTKKIKL